MLRGPKEKAPKCALQQPEVVYDQPAEPIKEEVPGKMQQRLAYLWDTFLELEEHSSLFDENIRKGGVDHEDAKSMRWAEWRHMTSLS